MRFVFSADSLLVVPAECGVGWGGWHFQILINYEFYALKKLSFGNWEKCFSNFDILYTN